MKLITILYVQGKENMTTKHMRIFLAVYEAESITEAARRLYMTQPAVSRTIQEVERYYGVRLFERINQRLYVTPAAKAFAAKARHIVATFDDMETTLRDWDELGVMRIGASITLGNFLLPRLAVRMKQLRPRLDLSVQIAQGEKIHTMLTNNEVDIAVIEHGLNDDDMVCQPFSGDQLIPVFSTEHPFSCRKSITLAELASQPLLMRERGSVGRNFLQSVFEHRQLQPKIIWESASTQALVRAAQAGLGVAILPEDLVHEDIEAGKVASTELSDETLKRTHYIVHHRNKYITAAMRDFICLCGSLETEQ